jgi:hypothetical protein
LRTGGFFIRFPITHVNILRLYDGRTPSLSGLDIQFIKITGKGLDVVGGLEGALRLGRRRLLGVRHGRPLPWGDARQSEIANFKCTTPV